MAFLLMAALWVGLFVSACDGKSDDTGLTAGLFLPILRLTFNKENLWQN